jgi:hypothetical protein
LICTIQENHSSPRECFCQKKKEFKLKKALKCATQASLTDGMSNVSGYIWMEAATLYFTVQGIFWSWAVTAL